MDELKTCRKCGRTLPKTTEYFYFMKSRNCFYWCCRSCEKDRRENDKAKRSEYMKAYREKNSERLSEYGKTYLKDYYRKNKAKLLEMNKRYRDANRERLQEKRREYYEQNIDHFREYHEKYYAINRDKYVMRSQIRTARLARLPKGFSIKNWREVLAEFGNKCAYCGAGGKLTQDHFVPVSRGGGYVNGNIVPACSHCNPSKRDKDFYEWYPSQPFYDKDREKHILNYLGKAVAI